MTPLETVPPDPHAGHGSMASTGGGLAEALARVEWVWLVAALVLAACYLVGVARLRRRGDRWPLGRTVSWLLGCATMVATISGELARLGAVRLSWHMVQHMVLSMIAPMLLVAAAPITLALRTLPTAGRGGGVRAG